MVRKIIYITGLILCFALGAYIWKVSTPVTTPPLDIKPKSKISSQYHIPVVYVGQTVITSQDIDWEYSLLTKGIFDSEKLTPVPDLGSYYEKALSPLKEKILSNIIERTLLYQYIKLDKNFLLSDSSRFTACLKKWQKTVKLLKDLMPEDEGRLKSRLCEKDIIKQYLNEIIFSKIKINEPEIVKYYKENTKKFQKPPMVIIRQIVLPSEIEAKRARYGLTRSNFAKRAKKLSMAPEAKNGGLLGPFAKGEMPRIFDVAFNMRRGEIRGILKSTYGFHLIMLEKKIKKVNLTLDEARPEIVKVLTKKKQEEEYQKCVKKALDTISVTSPHL